jgi:hypothetical protein
MMKQHQFDFLFQALDCNTNREGLHVLWTDSASWVRRSSVSGAADYFSDFTHRFAELFEAAMQYKLHWMIPLEKREASEPPHAHCAACVRLSIMEVGSCLRCSLGRKYTPARL